MSTPTSRLPLLGGTAVALALAGCGGGDDPLDPSSSANIALGEFPQASSGGDPRGTFTPNEPLVAFFNLPAGFAVDLTRNRGTGTITVSGATAASGTITASGVTFDVAGTIRTPIGNVPLDPEDFSTITEGSGTVTWRVIAGNRMVVVSSQEPEPDTLEYARTPRGLFLIDSEDTAPGQPRLTAVFALRNR